MEFTRDDLAKFNSTTHCHVCKKPFTSDDTRSLPFDRVIQRFRTFKLCNLNYKDSHCIPVVFHNLSGYDAHFIIEEIATAYNGRVELLPITKEKIYLIHEKC